MSHNASYNGFSNYPTWAAYQWLTGEAKASQMILFILDRVENAESLADELEDWISEANPLKDILDAPSLYQNLMGWMVGNINYLELAEKILEDRTGNS